MKGDGVACPQAPCPCNLLVTQLQAAHGERALRCINSQSERDAATSPLLFAFPHRSCPALLCLSLKSRGRSGSPSSPAGNQLPAGFFEVTVIASPAGR